MKPRHGGHLEDARRDDGPGGGETTEKGGGETRTKEDEIRGGDPRARELSGVALARRVCVQRTIKPNVRRTNEQQHLRPHQMLLHSADGAAWLRLAGCRPAPHAGSRRNRCALGPALGGFDDSLALGVCVSFLLEGWRGATAEEDEFATRRTSARRSKARRPSRPAPRRSARSRRPARSGTGQTCSRTRRKP